MVWQRLDSTEDAEFVRAKGLSKRRGLSRFYSDRSQSFASLDLTLLCTTHGESTRALAKRSSSLALSDFSALGSLRAPVSPGGTPIAGGSPGGGVGRQRLLHTLSDGGGSGEYEADAEALSKFRWPQRADDICAAMRMTSLGRAAAARHGSAAESAACEVVSFSQPPFHTHRSGGGTGSLQAALVLGGVLPSCQSI